MHIVMVTTGTLGDVQPFVALGLGLERAGYRITLAANPDHEPFVTGRGLAFRPVGGNMREALESDAGKEWLESAGNMRRYVRAFKRAFEPELGPFLRDTHALLADADAVVYQPFAWGAQMSADVRGIPGVCVSPFPFGASGGVEPLAWPGAPAWPWLRRWLHGLPGRLMWPVLKDVTLEHRSTLGLPPFRTNNPWLETLARVPLIHVFSPSVIPVPGDWGAQVHATGYCFLDAPDGWTPPPELTRFLSAGPPPIYVGFGSMTGHEPGALAEMAIEAVTRAKQRAILVSGWSGMGSGRSVPDHVHVTDSVPHDWLFPRVSAVVHHGGAGTTAAGLRAGKPTLIAAFFGDQPFWGHRVARIGAGPMPVLRKKINATNLAAAIGQLVENESFRRGAERVADQLGREDGVANAVALVGKYVGSKSVAQPLARQLEGARVGPHVA